MQLVLSNNRHTALAQQFVVVQQAAGNGVFDGDEPGAGVVSLHSIKHLLETVAAHKFDVGVREVLVGGNVVERTANALNGYFHRNV